MMLRESLPARSAEACGSIPTANSYLLFAGVVGVSKKKSTIVATLRRYRNQRSTLPCATRFARVLGPELDLRRVEPGLVDVPQCDQSTPGDDAADDGAADTGSAICSACSASASAESTFVVCSSIATTGVRGNIACDQAWSRPGDLATRSQAGDAVNAAFHPRS